MKTGTHFATFGNCHLEGFKNINPMKMAVTKEGLTEGDLREELQKPPFNNNYCTTYPIAKFKEMADKWYLDMYDLDDLRSKG